MNYPVSKLKDCCTIIAGQSPESKYYNFDGEGIPFFQGKADFGDLYPTIRVYCSQPTKIAEKDDILLSVRAPVGPTNLAPCQVCIGRGLTAIRPSSQLLTGYVLMFFRFFEAQLALKGTGTTFNAITQNVVKNLEIPIPPLDEQRRIVSRIEELFYELDNSVSTLQKTKEQLKVYRQAVLKEAFESGSDYEMQKTCVIGEVCLGRQRSPKNVSKDYPTKYIRAANITEQGLALEDVLEMEFTPTERKKYYLRQGDIIVSEASGSASQVGKPAIWKNEIEGCCFQNTVIRLRLYKDDPAYVCLYLKYLYMSGRIARIAGGVGINHLGANKFSNIEVPIPPLEKQYTIVTEIESRLSVCDSIQRTVDTALRQAEAMRQSILKQAFEGRL